MRGPEDPMLMLIFHSGDSKYALSGEVIIEVVPSIQLTDLPTAPDHVVGLLNFGGIPLPVIDFCMLMEGRPCKEALHTRIMLLEGQSAGRSLLIGLRAEKITEVFECELDEFQDKGVTCEKWPFLDGVIAHSKGVIQRVDADKLFEWYTKVIQEGAEAAIAEATNTQ